ncbi:MAG: hypothetical protein R2724_16550 [Bryobacterales bacterium]
MSIDEPTRSLSFDGIEHVVGVGLDVALRSGGPWLATVTIAQQ